MGARGAKAEKKKRKSNAIEARQSAYRTLILEAAERVFAEKGFDGAKIKDVADAAGLALGTVYVLFPSKQDVFSAVHVQRGSALFAHIAATVGATDAPFEALRRMQRGTFEFYAKHPFYLRMHLYSGTAWALPRLDVEEERQVFEHGRGALEGLFARAASRGELIAERPATCARMFLAMMQVFLAEWEEEKFATPIDVISSRFDLHVDRTFLRPAAEAARPARRASSRSA